MTSIDLSKDMHPPVDERALHGHGHGNGYDGARQGAYGKPQTKHHGQGDSGKEIKSLQHDHAEHGIHQSIHEAWGKPHVKPHQKQQHSDKAHHSGDAPAAPKETVDADTKACMDYEKLHEVAGKYHGKSVKTIIPDIDPREGCATAASAVAHEMDPRIKVTPGNHQLEAQLKAHGYKRQTIPITEDQEANLKQLTTIKPGAVIVGHREHSKHNHSAVQLDNGHVFANCSADQSMHADRPLKIFAVPESAQEPKRLQIY